MIRDSRIGPISETVARTGWPSCPNTSQNITGNWSGWYASPMSLARFTNASLASPGAAIPDKSPLMSAAKTGTPAREKPSARTCNVTVWPVTGGAGTGKTVTLQVLAEGFSRAGVPVFAADIKGDLSGMPRRARPRKHSCKRAKAWA